MSIEPRLPFELDSKTDDSLVTAHAGIPLLIELFRSCGAAKVMNERASAKQRKRGLTSSEMAESMFALWLAGGERCEDLERLREDEALGELLGHELPAPQTARDYFETFHAEGLPLWQQGEQSQVPSESSMQEGLGQVNKVVVHGVQGQVPQRRATLDVDATILESDKRSAKATYDGRRGYQPAFVVWAEQDLVILDEFRDGNVPAGSGNLRVVQRAVAALPPGIEETLVRGDSALYEQKLMRWLDERGIGFGISADMSPQLRAAVEALPEEAWETDRDEVEAVRQWAEVVYVPDDAGDRKDASAYRYLAIRVLKKQGVLFGDGTDRRHYCMVTNREGNGLELIRWHRGKAGTIEHVHDVLTNELAAEALPSQKFGANAAWVRMNVVLYNLLSALKRVALPEEFLSARPKRLRFVLFNTVGKVVRHAREMLLRLKNELARRLWDTARIRIHRPWPSLPGV